MQTIDTVHILWMYNYVCTKHIRNTCNLPSRFVITLRQSARRVHSTECVNGTVWCTQGHHLYPAATQMSMHQWFVTNLLCQTKQVHGACLFCLADTRIRAIGSRKLRSTGVKSPSLEPYTLYLHADNDIKSRIWHKNNQSLGAAKKQAMCLFDTIRWGWLLADRWIASSAVLLSCLVFC